MIIVDFCWLMLIVVYCLHLCDFAYIVLHNLWLLWKYFYSLAPMFMASGVLEFVVSNSKGNSQWENIYFVEFVFSWLKWTTKSAKIRTSWLIMISQYMARIMDYYVYNQWGPHNHLMSEWVSEWVIVAYSAVFQVYHGKNKFFFNEMMMRTALN